jgi:hypothetical protein
MFQSTTLYPMTPLQEATRKEKSVPRRSSAILCGNRYVFEECFIMPL